MIFRDCVIGTVILLVCVNLSFAQGDDSFPRVEEKPKVYLDGHEYPSFEDGSHYAWFAINIACN